MSNKTSDKNVAIIEELIQEYKTYNDLDGIQDLSIYVNALENILADYTRQKQINEEHQRINGELREKVKELEEEKNHWHGCFIVAMENGIAKEKVKDKIEEVHNMKFKDDRLNGATIDFAVHKFEELLEGENKNVIYARF